MRKLVVVTAILLAFFASVPASALGTPALDIKIDVGSIHFTGEIVEFYFATVYADAGRVDATITRAALYHKGKLLKDLTANVNRIDVGFFWVTYSIPTDAPSDTYSLLVDAKYMADGTEIETATVKSFLVSPTLMGWNTSLVSIKDDLAIIQTNLGTIKVSLDALDAKIVSVQDGLATIDTMLGAVQVSLSDLDAKVVNLTDKVATVETGLGTIQADLDDIGAKLESIDGTVATIRTDVGEVKTDIVAIKPTITSIEGKVATITTEVGTINADIANIKPLIQHANTTLVAIQGDLATLTTDVGQIKVSLTGCNARLTSVEEDAGMIETGVGTVKAKLEALNVTITGMEEGIATLETALGTLQGKVSTIQGDTVEIKTDIGIIKTLLNITRTSVTTSAGSFNLSIAPTNSILQGSPTFSQNTLTFTVSGPPGTKGSVSVVVPKALLIGIRSRINEVDVTFDGERVPFVYTELPEAYILSVTYTHSTHSIKIFLLGKPATPPTEIWLPYVAVAIAIITIASVATLLIIRRSHLSVPSFLYRDNLPLWKTNLIPQESILTD